MSITTVQWYDLRWE